MAHTSPTAPRNSDPRRPLRLVRSGDGPPLRDGEVVRNSQAVLGMKVVIGSEVVLFAALIVAYLALRAQAAAWPPPGQPRLPVAVTGVNTLVLLLSGITVWQALRAARDGHRIASRRWLRVTLVLGATFLLVQGSEWVRLIGYGLRISSSTYGGMFYSLIGLHALHVVAAVLILAIVLWRGRSAYFTRARQIDVTVGHLYWTFVVAMWPPLYVLVYLL
ncbi:MAG TPA: cytochrome c oxidase subunit 3 [Candidatus Dormibacteraeota bacterium]|nr:cytochrome c oxidase subunit 3 [Candidatus Dormibacteraeota bacterium]